MAGRPDLRIETLVPEQVDQVAAVLGLSRLDQGDGFYLVAWEGDVPLGHAHLALSDPPELQDVSVRPEYRRRGIARSLTSACEAEARRRGCGLITVTVSVDNDASQALYRGLGYVDSGVPPRRVRGTIMLRTGPLEVDDTLLVWQKPLA
jgi:ribosomal protein S18 acetylase RimI-like enzyme